MHGSLSDNKNVSTKGIYHPQDRIALKILTNNNNIDIQFVVFDIDHGFEQQGVSLYVNVIQGHMESECSISEP